MAQFALTSGMITNSGMGSFNAVNCCDGDLSAGDVGFSTDASLSGSTITMDLATAQNISELALYMSAAGAGVTFDIEYADAPGGPWNKAATGFRPILAGPNVVSWAVALRAPGGIIGQNVDGFDRTSGLYQDQSGNQHRTDQLNVNWAIPAKKYIDAGLGASRSVWRSNANLDGSLAALGDPVQFSYPIARIGTTVPGTNYDAINHIPTNVGLGGWIGGQIIGALIQDGSLSWDAWHAESGLWGGAKDQLIELYSCYAKGDGLEITDTSFPNFADGTVVRWCVMEHCGDDGIENDAKSRMTLYQCFISAMQVLSARDQANTPTDAFDASNLLYTIDGNLLWLRPMRFADAAHGGGALHAESFFKWKLDTASQPQGSAKQIPVLLKNNCFRYDTTGDWGRLLNSKIHVDSANNIAVFPSRVRADFGASGLPTRWPVNGVGVPLNLFTGIYYNEPGFVSGFGNTTSMAKTIYNREYARIRAQIDSRVVILDPGTFAGFGFGF